MFNLIIIDGQIVSEPTDVGKRVFFIMGTEEYTITVETDKRNLNKSDYIRVIGKLQKREGENIFSDKMIKASQIEVKNDKNK